MTFRGVIATAVISVTAVAPLKEVAQTLIDHRISGVPVVDDSGRVVGVVSEGDFLFKESGPAAIRRRRLARLLGDSKSTRARRSKVEATTAGEAMTSPAITIRTSEPVAEAARPHAARDGDSQG